LYITTENQQPIALRQSDKMETIRTRLSRKKRQLVITMLLGFLILLVGMICAVIGITLIDWIWVFIIVSGGLIAVISNFLLWFRMPCPLCGGNLGGAINTPGWSWKIKWKLEIPSQIKFCQYCGVSLDKEIMH